MFQNIKKYRLNIKSRVLPFLNPIKIWYFKLRIQKVLFSNSFFLLGLIINKLQDIDLDYYVLFFAYFLAQFFTFLVNDYYDRNYDSFSEEKRVRNIFCHPSLKLRKLGLFLLVLTPILAIILSFSVNAESWFILLIYLFLTFNYSSPPLRIKDRPPFDIIIHGLSLAMVSIAGYLYFFSIDYLFWLLIPLILVLGIIPQIGQQVHDLRVDFISNQETTIRKLGTIKAKLILQFLILFVFFWLNLIVFIFSFNRLIYVLPLLVILMVLYFKAKNYKKERVYLALTVGIALWSL